MHLCFFVSVSMYMLTGDTCLHKAVRSGDGALASLLILKGADMEQRNNAGFRALDLTKSQLLRELLLKTVSRRPVWFICGREDDELHFGLRIRRTLMARGGVECWFSGGGVSAAAMVRCVVVAAAVVTVVVAAVIAVVAVVAVVAAAACTKCVLLNIFDCFGPLCIARTYVIRTIHCTRILWTMM
jgi:hypothetical protein